ncbi:MAG: hypothetical protein FJX76_00375 [Armatimonadetes bacterium]|nr:hypothetical protein [Armatimonadota bacterium]
MLTRRRYFNAICAVLYVLLGLPAAAQVDKRSVIEGGKRVGTYELGKKWSAYEKVLGTPSKTQQSENAENARLVVYKQYGMGFFVKKDLVNGMYVDSPLFVTVEGVRVGMPSSGVEKAYGAPERVDDRYVRYPEKGLAFYFDKGKVTHIYVFDREERDLASGDRRIVPGSRVGGIQLGTSLDFVLKQWKNPTRRGPLPSKKGAELWSYQRHGVIVVAYEGRVDGVWIFNPEFRTGKEIHVGSARNEVVAAYGKADRKEEEMEIYSKLGLGFLYKENGKVGQIMVLETE